jgi:hypothetical protein
MLKETALVIGIGTGMAGSLIALPCLANDSAAELAAGGITLVRSDGIAMVSEDLTISTELVTVSYVFRNETQAPITTRVAFPVPEWDEEYEGDIDLDRQSKNPMNFSVKVDGKPVKFETDIKRKSGRVAVTHHWTQTFPVGDLRVDHRYRPVAGAFFGPDNRNEIPELDRQLRETYCVGPTLLAAIKKQQTLVKTVAYILKSGANWKGPIRKFKLTLVKDKPKDRISICLPDTRKASPTTFVVERTDFTPTQDLKIAFISTDM